MQVLSIPDYSLSPFGQTMDTDRITREIDVFNTLNKAISIQYKVSYLDVTSAAREAATDASFWVADRLHPSEKVYARWAEKIVKAILALLK